MMMPSMARNERTLLACQALQPTLTMVQNSILRFLMVGGRDGRAELRLQEQALVLLGVQVHDLAVRGCALAGRTGRRMSGSCVTTMMV